MSNRARCTKQEQKDQVTALENPKHQNPKRTRLKPMLRWGIHPTLKVLPHTHWVQEHARPETLECLDQPSTTDRNQSQTPHVQSWATHRPKFQSCQNLLTFQDPTGTHTAPHHTQCTSAPVYQTIYLVILSRDDTARNAPPSLALEVGRLHARQHTFYFRSRDCVGIVLAFVCFPPLAFSLTCAQCS